MRYLVGLPANTPGSLAMAFEGPDEEVLPRMLNLIKEGPSICWFVTTESPFQHSRTP